MIHTKKLNAVIAALTICAGLVSCGGNSDNDSSQLKSIETSKTTDTAADITVDSEETPQAETSENDDSSYSDSSSTADSDVPQSSLETIQISADWTDLEFVFDNRKIVLNETTLADLFDNGWTTDTNTEWLADVLNEQMRGSTYPGFTVRKGDYPEYSDDGTYRTLTGVSVDVGTLGNSELTFLETYITGFKAP
jgi:hypothetical protein